jgi:hypothetical protein
VSFQVDDVTFQVGVQIIAGLIVGWLVERFNAQTRLAESRAREAERLRDELGRRVDVLEAANRCSRALGSSLVMEQASAPSSASCAASCPSTGWRSCSRRTAWRG